MAVVFLLPPAAVVFLFAPAPAGTVLPLTGAVAFPGALGAVGAGFGPPAAGAVWFLTAGVTDAAAGAALAGGVVAAGFGAWGGACSS